MKVVQEPLGHTTPTITRSIYSQILPNKRHEAAELLAGIMVGVGGDNVRRLPAR